MTLSTLQFDPSMLVFDACKIIREKMGVMDTNCEREREKERNEERRERNERADTRDKKRAIQRKQRRKQKSLYAEIL